MCNLGRSWANGAVWKRWGRAWFSTEDGLHTCERLQTCTLILHCWAIIANLNQPQINQPKTKIPIQESDHNIIRSVSLGRRKQCLEARSFRGLWPAKTCGCSRRSLAWQRPDQASRVQSWFRRFQFGHTRAVCRIWAAQECVRSLWSVRPIPGHCRCHFRTTLGRDQGNEAVQWRAARRTRNEHPNHHIGNCHRAQALRPIGAHREIRESRRSATRLWS